MASESFIRAWRQSYGASARDWKSLERKLENVKIESDSLVAVNLITEGNPGNHL
ncbi:hypothetical protein RHMOL_Rhmol03G0078200 [Rhododendron molle]|uniref:Uncharacterized protein n=1 Tax=Rhododendron molle TaxID=49168 RepID=A0ACC0PBA4_RHOML|nr:hypothetical protein RHMOL_Rhmol03G0078200 [Rhododendron molle]